MTKELIEFKGFFSFLLSQSRQSVTSLYRFCIKKSNMVLSLWYSNHRLFKRWMPSQTGSKFSSFLTMKPQCKSYRIPNSHESKVWFKRRLISPRSANPDDNCLPPLPPPPINIKKVSQLWHMSPTKPLFSTFYRILGVQRRLNLTKAIKPIFESSKTLETPHNWEVYSRFACV